MNCLMRNSTPVAESIQLTKRKQTMVLRSVKKRALNPDYIKHEVQEDLITIKPLQRDGQYI
jgi:hypothetical protein